MNTARLFLSEPPEHLAQLDALLVDREDEMAVARQQVESVLAEQVGRPLAFVGLARVGKSHLLRKLAAEVSDRFDAVADVRISTGLSDGREVHREMLQQAYSAVFSAASRRGVVDSDGRWPLASLDEIFATYQEAVDGIATEVEAELAHETTARLKSSLGLTPGLPVVASLLAGGSIGLSRDREDETRTSSQRRVLVRPLGEAALAELTGMAHALVHLAHPGWRTLLVVDDFDLLRRADDGGFEPDRLLQSLAMLAGIPGLFVLTTVRDDTYRRHGKAFQLLALVKPFADDAVLTAVYRRHVDLYYEGEDPFAGAFVAEAAARSEGRIGVFLDLLREAFSLVPPAGRATLELRTWVSGEWEELERFEPQLARHVVRAALGAGGIIDRNALAELRASSLMRWVLEDYTSDLAARVHPVLLSVLREDEAGIP